MKDLSLFHNYKNNKKLRTSFNELAHKTFGIDFETWYEKGYWNENYICHSFAYKKKIVANVSVNRVKLKVNGSNYDAIHIGTVMTDPDYRGRGLSRYLLEDVIEKYKNDSSVFYLFANKEVSEFYPKFGFKKLDQSLKVIDILDEYKTNENREKNTLRKLSITDEKDLELIHNISRNRYHEDSSIVIEDSEHILMWYCLNVFSDNIYYDKEGDYIVIYEDHGDELMIYDIISKEEKNIMDVVSNIATKKSVRAKLHFGSNEGINASFSELNIDDTLFVLSKDNIIPADLVFRATSKA